MNITREEVLKIASISRIAITENEIDSIKQQLQDVLSYAQCVIHIGTEHEVQSSNKNSNYYREDVVIPSKPQALLECSAGYEEHFFVVPKILDTK